MASSCPIYSDPKDFYILPRHFTVCNQWTSNDKFIEDEWGDRYLNEPIEIIRCKCFLLLFSAPLHLVQFIYHVGKMIQEQSPLIQKITRLILTPLTLLAMTFAALYGLFSPWDGRKLYSTLERFHYHDGLFLAPCFQPSSDYHSRKKIVLDSQETAHAN
jgi:hypothetical protein